MYSFCGRRSPLSHGRYALMACQPAGVLDFLTLMIVATSKRCHAIMMFSGIGNDVDEPMRCAASVIRAPGRRRRSRLVREDRLSETAIPARRDGAVAQKSPDRLHRRRHDHGRMPSRRLQRGRFRGGRHRLAHQGQCRQGGGALEHPDGPRHARGADRGSARSRSSTSPFRRTSSRR